MTIPLKITFRSMQASEDIEAMIKNKAEKLNQFFGEMLRCRIIIEAHHKHHQQGNVYDVHIDISTPDKQIGVSRVAALNHDHEDVDVAIREAFESAKHQLQERNEKMGGNVTVYQPSLHGTILESDLFKNFDSIPASGIHNKLH